MTGRKEEKEEKEEKEAAELILPRHCYKGEHALEQALPALCALGRKALLVTGGSMLRQGHAEALCTLLAAQGVGCALYTGVTGEPTDAMVAAGVAAYRAAGCDFIIGLGGGSQLDCAKAIAAMAVHPGIISDYMGRAFTLPTPPLAAIPSTAGTGSEATAVTIITDAAQGVKMLLKGEVLLPQIAVADPTYTWQAPPRVTAHTGLDALTHAVEGYTSRHATPASDAYALRAVQRIFQYLPAAYHNGGDHTAREQLSLAAFEAGVVICNSTVTLVHGMSRPIGALFHIPHGLSNAMLLPVCLGFALDGAPERFAALGRAIGAAEPAAGDTAAARAFLAAVGQLCSTLQTPTLAQYGVERGAFMAAIPKMARDAAASGSPANTRRPVTVADMERLYRQLW